MVIITNESLNLLTLNIVNDSDIQFNMATDYFTVDMFTNRFTLYSYANDGSWVVYDSAPFSSTSTVEADPSATSQYIFEKAQALVTKYNTEGRKLHFDTVNSLDLTKQLAMSYLPDLDTEDDITPGAFRICIDGLKCCHTTESTATLIYPSLNFQLYFEKDQRRKCI